ncbi:MAG: 23S rRNA (adenine(2503)-C(2))-methyltransferase RlmN [Acidobacteria bacterium]|nr:23S rRNA (adenine(2503)-C(2))-methyltransferase RlmN [Acidobacteriota bacterium]
MKKNLLGYDKCELVELALGMGEKSFRGTQLYRQIYRKKALDVEQMTDLSGEFRRRLSFQCAVKYPALVRLTKARDATVKLLFELSDNRFVETVYIPEDGRDTLCISSQVGCDVGCTFCMTAQMGFQRNLKAGEIVGQVLSAIQRGMVRERGFNIVFMGMGEPLLNYQNVMKAFRIFIDQEGMGLSHRKITVSTSGVVPVLKKMKEEEVLPNLAISLNATTNELRDQIMPINRKWNIEELLDTCREFPLDSRRRITFEYVLLAGLNDSDEDARRLTRLLRGIHSKLNLIPYNVNPGLPFRRPSEARVERFQSILLENRVSAFVRKTRGDDVAAACGQLAYREVHA